MKKIIFGFLLGLIAGGAALSIAQSGSATEAATATSATTNPDDVNVLLQKVCTLNSIEANIEFQRNVQVMQGMYRRVLEQKQAIDRAQTQVLKDALQAEYDTLYQQLNENNQKMLENYNFTLNRNYEMVVEKSHVYVYATPEEIERWKEKQATNPAQ